VKVLIAPSAFSPHLGGIEELTAKLADRLREVGHQVMILTHKWPPDLAEREVISGTVVMRMSFRQPGLHPVRAISYAFARNKMMTQLDEIGELFHPDVVHAIGMSWQNHHVARWCETQHIPLLLTTQGESAMDDHRAFERGFRSVPLIAATRMASRAAALRSACSRWARDQAARIIPTMRDALIIPNGVSISEFDSVPNTPLNGPVLSYGRLVYNKGFDLLIDALRYGPRPLWIGGSGPMEDSLRRQADQLGSDVRFLGRLDRVRLKEALGRCSVVVMPSRLEPFGIVALEAMAAGRPVVASSNGGAPEFVRGGLLVDPKDSLALAAAVREALSSPELGKVGREAARNYDWQIIAGEYERAYRELSNQQLHARA
jgi:glycosyltransferase involved in cell wall biosynthesis